jgi:hypothetical protein
MSMQIHFNLSELGDKNPEVIEYDYVDKIYTAKIITDSVGKTEWAVDCDINGNCWFDCGSANELQMIRIKWLVQNRVCFNAS